MLRWSSKIRRAARISIVRTAPHYVDHRQWSAPSAGLHSSVSRHNKSSSERVQTSEDEFLDLIFGSSEGVSQVPKKSQKNEETRQRAGRERSRLQRRQVVSAQQQAECSTDMSPETAEPLHFTRKYRFRPQASSIESPANSATAPARGDSSKKTIPSLSRRWRLRNLWARLPSLTYPSEKFARDWHLSYHKLRVRYDKLIQDNYSPNKKIRLNRLHRNAQAWTAWALERATGEEGTITPETLRQNCDGEDPHVVWYNIALRLLSRTPSHVVEFLLATYGPRPFPPLTWVQDCIEYLAAHYRHTQLVDKQKRFEDLYGALKVLLDRRPSRETMNIRGSSLRHMIAHMSTVQMLELFELVRSGRLKTGPITLGHITKHLTDQGHLEQALEVLLEAKAQGCRVNSYVFLSCCANLLRQSLRHTNDLRLCSRLVDNFVEIGVKLDTQLTNIVLLNAIEAQDLGTARAIYSSMTANQVEPDDYTIAIMLKVCKKDPGDIELLKGLIDAASERGFVRKNSLIANEIMDCLTLHHTQFNTSNAYVAVLDAYLGLFDPEPVRRLGIQVPSASSEATESSSRLHATPQALRSIIALYLEKETLENAHALYNKWLDLVDSGESAFVATATGTFIPNVFLMRFTRGKSSLVHAAQVVKDMQQLPLPHSAGTGQRALPDVRTWTIFLQGFLKHGETQLAEQVVAYMKKKGIEPDNVTWNTLVNAHCRSQDVDQALEAMRQMRHSGFAFDEWTYRGLSRFSERNKVKLWKRMEQKKFEQEMDFTKDIKSELGSRLIKSPEVSRSESQRGSISTQEARETTKL